MHDLKSKNHVWTVYISWFSSGSWLNVNGKFMEAEKIILWKIEIHAVWQRHPWNVERGIHLIKHGSMLRIKLLHIQYCYSAKALDDFQLTNHKPDQSEIQNSLLVLNFIHQLPILYGYLPCQTLKITLEAYQTKIIFLNNHVFQNAYFGDATKREWRRFEKKWLISYGAIWGNFVYHELNADWSWRLIIAGDVTDKMKYW